MKAGKVVIQDAYGFYAWACGESCTMINVRFLFVSKEECSDMSSRLENVRAVKVKGTMKIHAVAGRGDGVIAIRDVRCYCEDCVQGTLCSTWSQAHEMTTDESKPVENTESTQCTHLVAAGDSESTCDYNKGDYVVAKYTGNWYVGKIVDVDNDDDLPFKVSFMEKKKRMYQWPCREDVIWCKRSDVLLEIDAPLPSGKSRRMFHLSAADRERTELLQF